MDRLRKRLEMNTRSILGLFRERVNIARDIGQAKQENSIPIRIRKREDELIESIPDLDVLSRSIISSLFEFTIINEQWEAPEITGMEESFLLLSGKIEHLQLMAGLIMSAPGVEVYSGKPLPGLLVQGIQANGAHVVVGEYPEPDLIVGIDCEATGGIMLSSNGTLKIAIQCLKSPKPVRILVKQH